jgi:hypothetical protein
MLRYSPPASARGYTTVTETEHKKFHAELVALGEKAVATAKKKGRSDDLITRYRALTGEARQKFFALHSAELHAAVKAKK